MRLILFLEDRVVLTNCKFVAFPLFYFLGSQPRDAGLCFVGTLSFSCLLRFLQWLMWQLGGCGSCAAGLLGVRVMVVSA